MSIKITQLVWNARIRDSSQKLVLLSLADRADDQGSCFPSVADIVRRTELSERQVQRDLAVLKRRRLIAVAKEGVRAGRHRPSRSPTYQLNLQMLGAIQRATPANGSARLSQPTLIRDATVARPTSMAVSPAEDHPDKVTPEPSLESSTTTTLTASDDILSSPSGHPPSPAEQLRPSQEEWIKTIRTYQDLWRTCKHLPRVFEGLSRGLAQTLGCSDEEAQRYLLEASGDD